jgi:NAD(P)H dehydrogenase (quinone)
MFMHTEPKSFNAALKDTSLDALKEKGHEVKLSDLYAVKFHPVLKASDFPERKNPDVFNPFFEAIKALKIRGFCS